MKTLQLGIFAMVFLAVNAKAFDSVPETQGAIIPIGISSYKAFFVHRAKYDLLEMFDQCLQYGLYPATIEDALENGLVHQFLSTTTELPSKTLWLGGTDFKKEGTFDWLGRAEMNYTNWASGQPSIDRVKNCMIITEDGTWVPETCHNVTHNPLCYTLLTRYPPRSRSPSPLPSASRAVNVKAKPVKIRQEGVDLIGNIGSKSFFVDNTMVERKWPELMTFCHELEMELISVDSEEELAFLTSYTNTTLPVGQLLVTSGTTLMTPSCESPTSHYYWFYSDETTDLIEFTHHHRYQVIAVSGRGLASPDLIGIPSVAVCQSSNQ